LIKGDNYLTFSVQILTKLYSLDVFFLYEIRKRFVPQSKILIVKVDDG